MKTLKITLLLAVFGLFAPIATHAQNLIYVHDDHVKPGMFSEYSKISKEFAEACKAGNVQNADFTVMRLDNGICRTVARIPNMAALDTNPFAAMEEKMGKEKIADLHARYDKCYDRHNSYLVSYIPDLSYAAAKPDTGLLYAKFHYMYVKPSQSKTVAEKIKALKEIYAKKKSTEYFDIYHSGIGCDEEFYCAVIWAKDETAYIKQSDDNEKLLGAEGEKIFSEMFTLVDRYEPHSAWEKPELSYTAKK